MTHEHDIADTFEITGRGAVAVIDDVTEREIGKAHRVEVALPSGKVLATEGYKEWLLRRHTTPIEKEAYMLVGLHKEDIPRGSKLRFVD